jgi:ADP-ribose pyrophosphatase YjhB (NUDIX family)
MTTEDEAEFLASYNIHDYDVPLTTVDVVVFTVRSERLCVQLVRRDQHPFRDSWALPGGFIDIHRDDDLEATARRVLAAKTGVGTPYLEQLGAFGNRARDPRGWAATFVYFALIDSARIGGHPPSGRWWPVQDQTVATPLAFDHADLLAAALERLRSKVTYTSLPLHLLPERFTLSQCQRVFEIVLGHPLEKSAFRRRLLDADLIERIEGAYERGSNRPAALFRLRPGAETVFFPGVLRTGQLAGGKHPGPSDQRDP